MKFEPLYDSAYWILLVSLLLGAGATFIMLVAGKEKDDRLNLELSLANESAAKANERAEQIKKELSWRRLTSEQRKTIASLLRPFPAKLAIRRQSGDFEAGVFAEDISVALAEAGWEVHTDSLMWDLEKIRFDISVSRTENGDSDRLRETLSAVGIPVELHAPAEQFELFIGTKPPMQ